MQFTKAMFIGHLHYENINHNNTAHISSAYKELPFFYETGRFNAMFTAAPTVTYDYLIASSLHTRKQSLSIPF
jgi:hypothetical protein